MGDPRRNAPGSEERPSRAHAPGFDLTVPGELREDAPVAPVPLVLGTNHRVEAIGPYQVTGTLGRGGMGIVYEVESTESGAIFALKTIETRFLELPDAQAGLRFGQEIRVMKRLDHPGVVKLFDYGFAHHPLGYEIAYFVMEKLEGDSFSGLLLEGQLFSPAEAARVAMEVAPALAYLAEHNVLHRDIKPANLWRTRKGRIVLMDFGLARSGEFTRLTRAGHVIGTLPYMSPEALRGDETDIRSDVYALGVVLFEMMIGAHPFTARDPTQLLHEIGRGLNWPDDFAFEETDLDLPLLLEKMLTPSAAARPTPHEVRLAAEAFLRRADPRGATVAEPMTGTGTPTVRQDETKSIAMEAARAEAALPQVSPGPLRGKGPPTAALPPPRTLEESNLEGAMRGRGPADSAFVSALGRPRPRDRAADGPGALGASPVRAFGGDETVASTTPSLLASAAGGGLIAPGTGQDQAISASAPVPLPVGVAGPRAGPSWAGAAMMTIAGAALAFGLGIWVGAPGPEPVRQLPVSPRVEPDPPQPRAVIEPPATRVTPLAEAPPLPESTEPEGPVSEEEERELAAARLLSNGQPQFSNARAAFRYGDLALKEGRYRPAIGALARALELNPAHAIAHRRLGDAHLSLGELDNARRHYKTYIALRPTAPDAPQVRKLIEEI